MSVGPYQVLIIVAVLVLLFGATKLPKLARSLGESARIFKAESKGLRDDDESAEAGGQRNGNDGQAGSSSKTTSKGLPESKQQEPLDAETVEHDDHNKAG